MQRQTNMLYLFVEFGFQLFNMKTLIYFKLRITAGMIENLKTKNITLVPTTLKVGTHQGPLECVRILYRNSSRRDRAHFGSCDQSHELSWFDFCDQSQGPIVPQIGQFSRVYTLRDKSLRQVPSMRVPDLYLVDLDQQKFQNTKFWSYPLLGSVCRLYFNLSPSVCLALEALRCLKMREYSVPVNTLVLKKGTGLSFLPFIQERLGPIYSNS